MQIDIFHFINVFHLRSYQFLYTAKCSVLQNIDNWRGTITYHTLTMKIKYLTVRSLNYHSVIHLI